MGDLEKYKGIRINPDNVWFDRNTLDIWYTNTGSIVLCIVEKSRGDKCFCPVYNLVTARQDEKDDIEGILGSDGFITVKFNYPRIRGEDGFIRDNIGNNYLSAIESAKPEMIKLMKPTCIKFQSHKHKTDL